MDTFFCRVGSPLGTETALGKVYEDIGGYGVIGLKNGANSLKDQVIASLGKAIVTTMTKESVEGLQTMDGISVSSLSVSINASLRETLSAISKTSTIEDTSFGETNAVIKEKTPETDFERLIRELNSNDLSPVRAALLLSLDETPKSLIAQSAQTLLIHGITVEDLTSHGYPDQIIDLLKKTAKESLKNI